MNLKYIFFLFLFSFSMTAHDLSKAIKKTARSNESFNQTSFKSCLVDKNGVVWIATHMGLFKYDGKIIKPVFNKSYPFINTNRIGKLGRDYETGDLFFVTYPENSTYIIRDNVIKRLDNLKYKNQYLFTINNQCLIPSNPFHKNVIDYVHQNAKELKFDRAGEINLLKLNKNFYYLTENKILVFSEFKVPQTIVLPNNSQYTLLRFNETIVLLSKNKAFLLDNNKLKPIKVDFRIHSLMTQKNGFIRNFLYCDKDVNYINHNRAIYQLHYHNKNLNTIFIDKNEDSNSFSLVRDAKKELYFFKKFTTDFTIIKPNYFNVITTNDSDKNNCHAVTKIDSLNLFSASGWLYNFESKKLKKITNPLYNKGVLIPFKNTFYGTDKERLYDIKNRNVIIDKPYGTVSGYTYFKNKLWVAQNNYLLYYDNYKLTQDAFFLRKAKDFNINSIYTHGKFIIVLTDKGVLLYDPNVSLTPISGLQGIYARYYKTIDEDSFWIGTYGDGLYLYKNRKVFKAKDLTNNLVATHAIEEDLDNNLWISTNSSLLSIGKKEAINKIITNQPLSFYRFFKQDGLPTNEFNGGGTHPSMNNYNGVIGFPTVKGFVWFDSKEIKRHPFRSAILIDKISVDGKEINSEYTSSIIVNSNSQLIDLEANYAYYHNRDNLSFEYKYADENKWHKVNNNSIQLFRDSFGKKKLLIRVHTYGFDAKYDIIKSIDFYFQPKYHETIWFRLLCVLIIILFLIGSYKIGLIMDKRNRLKLEQKIKLKTAEIEFSKEKILKSLKEKEILLKEIHHRVKNNLQLVISMMSIQARRENYADIDEFIETSRKRISSMILIHQNLYQRDSLEAVDIADYIQMLVNEIGKTFESNNYITTKIETHNITLPLPIAIPFGIIINEIITNALKHAFPDNREGTITINLQNHAQIYTLVIEDDGVGFAMKDENKNSFGLDLITLLVDQLKGMVVLESSNKTKYTITFQEIED